MKLIKPVQHEEGNVVRVVPVDFSAGNPELEMLKVEITPGGFVSIANYLHNRVLATYQSALGDNPIYVTKSGSADISELLENKNVLELIGEGPGIGICLPHENGKTTVLIRQRRLATLACSSDLTYWSNFWVVQPASLNDALVEYVKGQHPIPTQIGDRKMQYSLEGHSINITRERVPSVRDAHVEKRLTRMLDNYGIR